MSLRDELVIKKSGYSSGIDLWLSTQDAEFQAEFHDLVNDQLIGHSVLHRLALKYGCPVKLNGFTDWRKQQWV